MNPQHCKHCNRLYAPSPTGMGSLLCRGCAVDCDLVYGKVHSYIRQNDFVSAEQVASGANVPAIFVMALIREGRFGDMTDIRVETGCIRCGKELQKNEISLCNPCKVLISRKMQPAANKPPAYIPPPKPDSSSSPPRSGRHDDDSHKYGLGGR